MGIKSFFGVLYARLMAQQNKFWIKNPIEAQKKVFKNLISKGSNTSFGKEHGFNNIVSYEDFRSRVPVRDYEGHRHYIESILSGKECVLWPGRPLYFCKTSGTTSGAKYIPISKESMPYHLKCARDAILSYINETGCGDFLNGKNIFIQGSPKLNYSKGSPIGRLSGIVAHHIPWYLTKDNKPSFKTNCIDDWEKKIDAIVDETLYENMTLISGIPPWVQMYFERIIKRTNKKIKDVFPNYSLFIYGGVNFEPYKSRFLDLVGKKVDSLETYPASEGFIAYQDKPSSSGMLLCVNHGIFYEFIESSQFFDDNPKRVSLADVVLGKDYVIILSTNAGLWAYNIGDVVRFVSVNPYRLVVSGRINHYTSAFGEHVIAKEVEEAMKEAVISHPASVGEFHVAPTISPKRGLPFHEWFIEFNRPPKDEKAFAKKLNEAMEKQNSYYEDLIKGGVLKSLVISKVKKGGFYRYMKSIGKLGGQNKPPRLSNNRKIANYLTKFLDE